MTKEKILEKIKLHEENNEKLLSEQQKLEARIQVLIANRNATAGAIRVLNDLIIEMEEEKKAEDIKPGKKLSKEDVKRINK